MRTTFNTADDMEQKAKAALERSVYDYIAGGAGTEQGLENNNRAFQGYHIVPRVLQKSGNIDTKVAILGEIMPSPVMIAPCAFHKLVCPEGEITTAKAAADSKAIMTLSTMSTCTIEDVAKSASGTKWFQLYVYKDRDITVDLIRRAEKSGYKALVVTVDVPAMGMRTRDIKNKFSLPQGIEAVNFKQFGLSSLSGKVDGSKVKDHTDNQFDADLGWDSIDWLRSVTRLPILLKGILHPEDAEEALQHGVAGIIVSNHGGRQIDSVVPAIDALFPIAKVVNNRVPLIVDGGIRSGEDIFKAIALGATSVMIARSVMWALAIGGQTEVNALFKRLQDELILTMRLAGCNSLEVIRERGLSMLSGPGIQSLHFAAITQHLSQQHQNPDEHATSSLRISK